MTPVTAVRKGRAPEIFKQKPNPEAPQWTLEKIPWCIVRALIEGGVIFHCTFPSSCWHEAIREEAKRRLGEKIKIVFCPKVPGAKPCYYVLQATVMKDGILPRIEFFEMNRYVLRLQ